MAPHDQLFWVKWSSSFQEGCPFKGKNILVLSKHGKGHGNKSRQKTMSRATKATVTTFRAPNILLDLISTNEKEWGM